MYTKPAPRENISSGVSSQGGGGGGTLFFSYIRRLGSFFFFLEGGVKMQCLQKILVKYSIKLILYFLYPCGTDLPIALRKGTDQPVKVIGCELDVNCL